MLLTSGGQAGAMGDKKIRIQYFALLREERGLACEDLSTRARDALELYKELQAKHGFTLDKSRLRVAINDQFETWEIPLNENDKVVFVPPVAGG